MRLRLVLQLTVAICLGVGAASRAHALPTLIAPQVEVDISFSIPSSPPPMGVAPITLPGGGNRKLFLSTVLSAGDSFTASNAINQGLLRNGVGDTLPANMLIFLPTVSIGADFSTIRIAVNPDASGMGRFQPGAIEFDFIFSNLVLIDASLSGSSLVNNITAERPITTRDQLDLGFDLAYIRGTPFVNFTTPNTQDVQLTFQSTVPEPGTLALLAGVAIAAIAVRRSKCAACRS